MCNTTTVTAEARARAIVDETKSNLQKTISLLNEATQQAHQLDNLEDLKVFYLTSQELVNIALEIKRGFALAKEAHAAATASGTVPSPAG